MSFGNLWVYKTGSESVNRETPYKALERWHETAKLAKRSQGTMSEFMQLRGETVINMGNVPDKLKTKMIKVIRKGYSRIRTGLWPSVLHAICNYGPVPVPIGYLGRSNGLIWLPNDNTFDDKIKTMQALMALTGDIKATAIKAHNYIEDIGAFKAVNCNVAYSDLMNRSDMSSRHSTQPQLMSYYNQLKFQIDEYMEEAWPLREPLVDIINSTQNIIIPFSTRDDDL